MCPPSSSACLRTPHCSRPAPRGPHKFSSACEAQRQTHTAWSVEGTGSRSEAHQTEAFSSLFQDKNRYINKKQSNPHSYKEHQLKKSFFQLGAAPVARLRGCTGEHHENGPAEIPSGRSPPPGSAQRLHAAPRWRTPPPAPAAPALHAALLRPPGPAPLASALPRAPIRARTAWSPPRPTEPRLTMTAARTPRAPACLAAAQPEKEDLVAAQPLPALWCPSAPHPVPPPSRPAALTRRLGSPHTPHPRCAAPRSPPQSLPPHPVGPPPPPALRDSFLAEGFGVTAVPSPKSSF